jgi:trehalose 6-phosphate synthase
VNPYDVEGVAATLRRTLELPREERRARMRRLRRAVRAADVYAWLDGYLRAAIERDLSVFPLLDDWMPDPRESDAVPAH